MKKSYTKGENVEKFCPACDQNLAHIVREVTKTGAVSKVNCSKCGLVSTSNPTPNLKKVQNLKKPQNLVTKTVDPYSQTQTYQVGQIMAHPKFGIGEVKTASESTIEVKFLDGFRRLVHSRD